MEPEESSSTNLPEDQIQIYNRFLEWFSKNGGLISP